ncbi:unnamed protein product [Caretta caretta]
MIWAENEGSFSSDVSGARYKYQPGILLPTWSEFPGGCVTPLGTASSAPGGLALRWNQVLQGCYSLPAPSQALVSRLSLTEGHKETLGYHQ